jgi:bifunctional non-homologous end joining protein LigD
MKKAEQEIIIDSHKLKLTNLDKTLFPEDKITKGDLIQYYMEISETMVMYMRDHPVSMQRYPDGIYGESFFQKDAPAYFPKWITIKEVKKKEGGSTRYVICQNRATLIYLANLACITPHLWLSSIDKLLYPDRMIFDLDPSIDDFKLVAEVSLILKSLLEELGLIPFVMTTGSRGVHVIVPLDKRIPFKGVQLFAFGCANLIFLKYPEKVTLSLTKSKRKGRLFIDTNRNAYSATAVSPYSVRAQKGAPVASPLYWTELQEKDFNSQHYKIKDITILKKRDPWGEKFWIPQSLEKPTEELIRILNEIK